MSDIVPDPVETEQEREQRLHEQRMANIAPHQFKRGESGNPEGRKPGTSVRAELQKAIEDRADDRLAEAMANVAIQKALKGDYRFFRLVCELNGDLGSGANIELNAGVASVAFHIHELKPPPDWKPRDDAGV